MLSLKCDIEIKCKDSKKTITFDYCNDILIKTSCKNLTDTAVLKVPRKMQWQGKALTDFVNVDDAIIIKLGYAETGNMEMVFKGYIKSVENTIKEIVIYCENEMRLFKSINVDAEIIEHFDFKKWMKKYVPELRIELPDDVNFGQVKIAQQTLAQALDKLISTYPWLKGFFREGVFYGITTHKALANGRILTFDPERNQISDSLKYTTKEDVKIAIKATSIQTDNTKLECIIPQEAIDVSGKSVKSDYEQRHFYFSGMKTQTELKAAAEKIYNEYACDKMTGNITGFGVPYVRKGDIVRLQDKLRKERDGRKFWVDSVDYKFGTSGYRQVITLGYAIK